MPPLIALLLTALLGAQTFTRAQDLPAHRGYAGMAFGSPSAFALGWGAVGAGAYAQTLSAPDAKRDGSAAVAFGLGDADRFVALETAVTFASLSGSQGSSARFGDVGAFSFKVSRSLGEGGALAAGVLSATSWGYTKPWEQPTYYLVGTRILPLQTGLGPRPLVLSLGVASSGFEKTLVVDKVRTRAFGSVAFYFNRQVSLIADHTGRFANLGLSIAPFAQVPLTVTLGAVNLGDADRLGRQFGIAVGAAFRAF